MRWWNWVRMYQVWWVGPNGFQLCMSKSPLTGGQADAMKRQLEELRGRWWDTPDFAPGVHFEIRDARDVPEVKRDAK